MAPRRVVVRPATERPVEAAIGFVARYIGRHGTSHFAKVVLISSISPDLLKSASNPGGIPIEVLDGSRRADQADRSKFWTDLSLPFYGYNRPEAEVSESVREAFWLQ